MATVTNFHGGTARAHGGAGETPTHGAGGAEEDQRRSPVFLASVPGK